MTTPDLTSAEAWMTPGEAAPYLGVSRETVYRRVKKGEADEIGGTHILGLPRVRRDLVMAMAAKATGDRPALPLHRYPRNRKEA